MSFGCVTCTGSCCREYLVHVSGRDAVTIARAQALDFSQFLDFWSEAEPTMLGFRLAGRDDTVALALRRRGDKSCTFLIDLDDGISRCGTYSSRPLTCAAFPLHLFHGSAAIREGVICERSGRRITAVDFGRARPLLVRGRFEWALYGSVVEAWNARRDALAARADEARYFAYLGAAYDAVDAAYATFASGDLAEAMAHWADADPDPRAQQLRADLDAACERAIAQAVNALDVR